MGMWWRHGAPLSFKVSCAVLRAYVWAVWCVPCVSPQTPVNCRDKILGVNCYSLMQTGLQAEATANTVKIFPKNAATIAAIQLYGDWIGEQGFWNFSVRLSVVTVTMSDWHSCKCTDGKGFNLNNKIQIMFLDFCKLITVISEYSDTVTGCALCTKINIAFRNSKPINRISLTCDSPT